MDRKPLQNPVLDLERGIVTFDDAHGHSFELSLDADGVVRLWNRNGGRIFTHNSSGNVVEVTVLPNFVPPVMPTERECRIVFGDTTLPNPMAEAVEPNTQRIRERLATWAEAGVRATAQRRDVVHVETQWVDA